MGKADLKVGLYPPRRKSIQQDFPDELDAGQFVLPGFVAMLCPMWHKHCGAFGGIT
jgi:hypothetical protein